MGALLALSGWLPGALWAGGSAAYRRIAAELARIAQRAGIERITLLPFDSSDPADAAGGTAVSERLVSALAQQPSLKVVERRNLGKVLAEQKLQNLGMVDARDAKALGRTMGVDAVVTGTLLRAGDGQVEINARLIDAQDARVLGAAVGQVRRDWERAAPSAPAPEDSFIVPLPELDMDFTAWWERGASAEPSAQGCSGWEERVDRLQAGALELKARFWVEQMRSPSFSLKEIRRNPGSEIRNLQIRAAFYRRLRELYDAGVRTLLTQEELSLLQAAEAQAARLMEGCER